MDRNLQTRRDESSHASPPSDASLFVRAILDKPFRRTVDPKAKALLERRELERLAPFSPRHAAGLRRLEAAEAEARRQRRLLEWCSQISPERSNKRHQDARQEAEVRERLRRTEQFTKTLREGHWDPSKHPRGGYPENRGWWSPAGGNSAVGDSGTGDRGDRLAFAGPEQQPKSAPQPVFDALNPHRPSKNRGIWLGDKGNSLFRLHKPASGANGKLVREIPFSKDLPVLDKLAYPGKTATIILTGDIRTDRRNAQTAWKKLNPGKEIPKHAVFHHDLLKVAVHTEKIDGKPVKLLVGKMQLIPMDVHRMAVRGAGHRCESGEKNCGTR